MLSKKKTGQKEYDLRFWGDFGESSDVRVARRQNAGGNEMFLVIPWRTGSWSSALHSLSLFKGTAPGPTLGTATAETRCAEIVAHGQGTRVTRVGRGGNTKLLGNVNVAAPRATRDITRAAKQGFEDVIARLAMIFVDWHNAKSPHAGRAVRVGQL
jgi:hypothetical protein